MERLIYCEVISQYASSTRYEEKMNPASNKHKAHLNWLFHNSLVHQLLPVECLCSYTQLWRGERIRTINPIVFTYYMGCYQKETIMMGVCCMK